MPPIEFLPDREFYALLKPPYNPVANPSSDFSEHERPHRQMKDALFALGGGQCWGPHSYEAFSAAEDGWTCSRYVGASIRSPLFIRPDLFHYLYDIVTSFEHDYVMHIISDFDELPEFELLISKHRFITRMPDRSQLSRIYEPGA